MFLSNVCTAVDCTGVLGNVKILSLTLLNSKVNSAIQYLFFLKSQIDKSIISPAVYEQKITPKYGEKQPPFVCKQTWFYLTLCLPGDYFGGNNHLHNYFIFRFDFFLSSFNNLFKHKKKINNRKQNREKIDCQSSLGVTQGSVISTLMHIHIIHCNYDAQSSKLTHCN